MARLVTSILIATMISVPAAPLQAFDKVHDAEALQQHLDTSREQMRMLGDRTKALASQFDLVKTALLDSRRRNQEQAARISALGNQLETLHRQRRLRTLFFSELASRIEPGADLDINGDKVVLSGDWLFEPDGAAISVEAEERFSRLAEALLEVANEVPRDVSWSLRIEGHTDSLQPGPDSEFESDWALSSARALAVLERLQERGLSRRHLAAAALADTRPLVFGGGEAAKRLNRRIEIHLAVQ